ncbi:rhamnogalacturonan acetylesterase [Filimonas effusa]|uniref:Rhamnogalacturonan acetylesterase n=2 Tax=Filimonas effusa TaxID=2508721 RepID=A0A4Q1DD50_9BACT|nr:rhamnogalacturonan acetylesterase [Filimonas effusa]
MPVLCVSAAVAAQPGLKFDFGKGEAAPGYIHVKENDRYNDTLRYGFEFGSSVRYGYNGGNDPMRDGFVTSDQPFYFSVKLPEGNYDIKLLFGDKQKPTIATVKAECRRLMAEKIVAEKGKFVTQVITVHVKDSVIRPDGRVVRLKPREIQYLHWDDKLTLEFGNKAASLCAIEIIPNTKATTIFLAGNSTVVDQPEEPWAAWGQMAPAFFRPELAAIANYAESGETLKAFQREKRLEKIWSMAKPGDYLFIEFTHNDQKPGGNHLDPFTSYKDTLKSWIAQARGRGLKPVLVTSMHRRNFDSSGRVVNTLLEYPDAMRSAAKEEGVPLIDLNAMSKTLYEAWGPERSIKAFVHFPANTFPGQKQELKDNTHFSTYGAYELAKCVVLGIRKIPELAVLLKSGIPEFDPARPDAYEAFDLPASAFSGVVKPDGN